MNFWSFPLIFQRLYNYIISLVFSKKTDPKHGNNRTERGQLIRNQGQHRPKVNARIYKFSLNQISDSFQSGLRITNKKTKMISRKGGRKRRQKPKMIPKIYERQNYEQKNDNLQQCSQSDFVNESGQSISPITRDINNSDSSNTAAKQLLIDFQQLFPQVKLQGHKPSAYKTRSRPYGWSEGDIEKPKQIKNNESSQKLRINTFACNMKKKLEQQIPIYQAQNQFSNSQIKLSYEKYDKPNLVASSQPQKIQIKTEQMGSYAPKNERQPAVIVLDSQSESLGHRQYQQDLK